MSSSIQTPLETINEVLYGLHGVEEHANKLFTFEGKPFTLQNHTPFKYIFEFPFKNIILQTGRQVAKSTMLSIEILLLSMMHPHFRAMYTSTSESQMKTFSRSRVGQLLKHSPLVKALFFSGKQGVDYSNNISYKQLTNSSEIYFSYISDDADRARGNSADGLYIDEAQDVSAEVVPVAQQVLKASDFKYFYRTGTPKTHEHYLTYVYDRSVQHEWIIPCRHCGIGNIPNDLKMIGKKGLICKNCGSDVNTRDGFWFTPTLNAYKDWSDDPLDSAQVRDYGFHIPQFIIPMNCENPINWAELKKSLKDYPDFLIYNEILGLPYSLGTRIVTREELKSMCTEDYLHQVPPQDHAEFPLRVAGIDWSGGGSSGNSRTALIILGYDPLTEMSKVLYYKVYPIGNPVNTVNEIVDVLKLYMHTGRGLVIGADAGEGSLANATLSEKLTGVGSGIKIVHSFQFGSFKKGMSYDQYNEHILVARTKAIDTFFFSVVKKRKIQFPKAELCEELFDHILAEYETVVGRKVEGDKTTRVWRHHPDKPDDAFMALIFAWLTLRLITRGNSDLLT
jgi:transcription elongation factor Elf1